MKKDLITKHPLLQESKHMLYCTYTPHLLYSQAHIILMHTESHLLHSAMHLTEHTLHTDCILEAENSHYTAPECFDHCTWKVHVCYNVFLLWSHTSGYRNARKIEIICLCPASGLTLKEQELALAPSQK